MTNSINIGNAAASDNTYLKTKLSQLRSNVNIGHLNVQSLVCNNRPSKFLELKSILDGKYLDILGCTETWTKSYITNKAVNVKGYKLFRNDRPAIRGGGVALYVSDTLAAKTVDKSTYLSSRGNKSNQMEFLLVSVGVGMDRILVGVFYFPNRNNRDLLEAESVLQNYAHKYKNIILMGDFNNDLLVNTVRERNVKFFDRYGLTVVHNGVPTHCGGDNVQPSLLDFFVTSDSSSVALQDQFWVWGIGRHALIFVSLKLEPTRAKQKFYFRDYQNLDTNALLEKASTIDFNQLYCTNSVDIQLDILSSNIDALLKEFLPVKPLRPKQQIDIFNDPELIANKNLRDLAYSTYLRDKTNLNRRAYCKYRNKCNAIVRKLKHNLGISTFGGELSTKQLWMKLHEIGVSEKADRLSYDFQPDDLNDHFAGNAKSAGLLRFDETLLESEIPFSSRNFNILISAFWNVKPSSTGLDKVPLKFISMFIS